LADSPSIRVLLFSLSYYCFENKKSEVPSPSYVCAGDHGESRPLSDFSAHCVDKTENGIAFGKLETHVKKIIDSEQNYEEPKVWVPEGDGMRSKIQLYGETMKIARLLIGLMLLMSTALQAQPKEVKTTFTEYGFSVLLSEDVTLTHGKQEDGRDSTTGKPTKEDTFISKDSNHLVRVITYADPIVATTADLETVVKAFAHDAKVSEITPDKHDGQPSVSTLFTITKADGSHMYVDVLVTFKGNRLFVVNYIFHSRGDLEGFLFLEGFKLL